MKYEAPSSTAEEHLLKQRYLAITFSLVEKIIKYISTVGENEGITFLLYDPFSTNLSVILCMSKDTIF